MKSIHGTRAEIVPRVQRIPPGGRVLHVLNREFAAWTVGRQTQTPDSAAAAKTAKHPSSTDGMADLSVAVPAGLRRQTPRFTGKTVTIGSVWRLLRQSADGGGGGSSRLGPIPRDYVMRTRLSCERGRLAVATVSQPRNLTLPEIGLYTEVATTEGSSLCATFRAAFPRGATFRCNLSAADSFLKSRVLQPVRQSWVRPCRFRQPCCPASRPWSLRY